MIFPRPFSTSRMKDKTKPNKLKDNGIVMADCIMAEANAAIAEKRYPKDLKRNGSLE